MKKILRNLKTPFAFTLIEVLIGAGLIAFAVGGLAAIFTGVIKIQRRAFLEAQVLDNARYAMETVARAVRVADIQNRDGLFQDILLDKQTMLGGAFSCDNEDGCAVRYSRDAIQQTLLEERNDPTYSSGNFPSGLVSTLLLAGDANVRISRFNVLITGCTDQAINQPRVTFVVDASPRQTSDTAPLSLQTTVSLRKLHKNATCDPL